ncbi:MAG: hypothetical protein ACO1RX_11230 [Candidatus Sericytochromatia bacterium]
MCTWIAKETDEHLTVLRGPTCCLPVEALEAIHPKISRANGWNEIYVGRFDTVLPPWTGWLTSEQKQYLPAELRARTEDGKKLIFLDIEDDLLALLPAAPIAELDYRGTLLHFAERGHIVALRDFIASGARQAEGFGSYARYLQHLPKGILGKADRPKVVRRLEKLLAGLGGA